jgi:hypothetical protein
MAEVKYVEIGKIALNPNNPRTIKDGRFKQLVKSIKNFPEMLELRPIVVNSDMVVLGGNMRLKACKEAGLKKVPIIKADDLTPEQQREFIIKDNVGFGDWDFELLRLEWDGTELEDWGLDLDFTDYGDKNKELDMSDYEDPPCILKLEYTEDEYVEIKQKIKALGVTPEKVLYDALVSL